MYVTGVGSQITGTIAADGTPLPTQLGGITVTKTQFLDHNTPVQIPILAVYPRSSCLGTPPIGSCGSILAVVVQIPFSLLWDPQGGNGVFLIVSDGKTSSGAVSVLPVVNSIHIGYFVPGAEHFALRLPNATHADGMDVNAFYPAKPGEELILYATGLGPVVSQVPDGAASPSPGPRVSNNILLNFEYRANSNFLNRKEGASKPLFAGLVPGSVGAYQINFVVPPVDKPVANCDLILANVLSNFTVTDFSRYSADNVGICVDASGFVPLSKVALQSR